MVDQTEGQLYTIEGLAAALIMVLTAYLILGSTFILTPGDTHINDMQLEQLGNDVLKIMDTAESYNSVDPPDPYLAKQSFLEKQLSTNFLTKDETFIAKFHEFASDNEIELLAKVYYRDGTEIKNWEFSSSPSSTNREHFVTVTKWVYLDNPALDPNPQSVLLEVTLWRD